MILLDTNVISEVVRPRPEPRVARWLAAQRRRDLLTSAIVRAEILHGIAMLPDGERRRALLAMANGVFEQVGRVLPFTAEAATYYARITASRRRAGKPIGAFDALIAATALTAGAAIATRDVSGFDGCGLVIVNPWEAE